MQPLLDFRLPTPQDGAKFHYSGRLPSRHPEYKRDYWAEWYLWHMTYDPQWRDRKRAKGREYIRRKQRGQRTS